MSKSITFEEAKEKIKIEFYAVKEDGKFNHFYKTIHPAICNLIGKSIDDFRAVDVTIEDEINLDRDAHFYNGVLCGFYDFEKDELSGAYIYNSFLQTQVCFPYSPETYHQKSGLFVTLKVTEQVEEEQ